MKIEYMDKYEQSDPAMQRRSIAVQFDTTAELAALNRAGTPRRIVEATLEFMKTFLEENAKCTLKP